MSPGAGDHSDANSDEWEKMNLKNGIKIGVGSRSLNLGALCVFAVNKIFCKELMGGKIS